MIQPLRLEIPSEIITDRLLLRSPRVGDSSIIFDTVRNSLPELKTWMPWANDDYDLPSAEDWCRRSASRFILREEAGYLIFPRETTRHIGTISAFNKNWDVPRFEIGYWLATSEVGHGHMTEAVRAVTQMAFDDFKARRIEIRVDAKNNRSRRVAERAGYLLEGIQINAVRKRWPAARHVHVCVDVLVFACVSGAANGPDC